MYIKSTLLRIFVANKTRMLTAVTPGVSTYFLDVLWFQMKKIIGKIAILLVQVFTVTSHFFCNKYNIIFSSEKDHLGDWSPEKDCCW